MVNFGDRLQEERLKLNLNQEEFGKIGGVTKKTQHLYENNSRTPDANYLALIEKYGVDVMYVLTGVRSQPAPKTYSPGEPEPVFMVAEETSLYDAPKPLNKREQALLANYRESDEEAKKALESTARAFSRQDQKDGTSGK